MKPIPANLTDCYVRRHGRILPFGVIQTFLQGVPDCRREEAGCPYWSEELLKYGNGKFQAIISAEAPGYLLICKNGREIARIPESKIFYCNIWEVAVCTGGFILATISYGKNPENRPEARDLVQNLNLAYRGQTPKRLDNSTFVKVAAQRRGEILVQIRIGDTLNPQIKMFTPAGKSVNCETGHWLALDRWK